jgi:tripartite-type tricarboxylate transporter receptor subunit TctC
MKRRQFACAASLSVISGMNWAQSAKPIRLIVPFPAGGPTDIVSRVIADPLGKLLGQSVVVDNKAGAGGSIGMGELARAQPDGLTLGVATVSTHGVNPAVYKKLPYDPIKDFVPVTELVKAPVTLVVHPSLQVKTMAEFIAYLKKNPGKVSYGSPGNGTIGHMLAELFKSTTNTFMLHIPYRGTGPAMTDLLSGQIQVYFDQVASSIPHIKSGKLRSLAVSWPQRLDILPDVPTFAEVSLFANNNPSWFGLLAPAKTPEAEVRRVQQAVAKVIAEPSVKERFAQLGLFASGSTPQDFSAVIQKEIATMSRVAKFAKISVD